MTHKCQQTGQFCLQMSIENHHSMWLKYKKIFYSPNFSSSIPSPLTEQNYDMTLLIWAKVTRAAPKKARTFKQETKQIDKQAENQRETPLILSHF